MKGLELAEEYYKEYGEKMLKEQFPEVLGQLAVGLVGSGSECLGYDDEISRDHDFEPGFTIFIPGEAFMDSKKAFLLERAYAKLPKEFMGFTRSVVSPVGGNRHGVVRLNEFLKEKLGNEYGELGMKEWLTVPEYSILEVINGKLFFDGSGTLSSIRENLAYMPEDVRKKKIAGNLLMMGQSGQYNYARLVKRGEEAAAQLAVYEYVKATLHVIYSLNGKYMPYYKWAFRGLRDLAVFSNLESDLTFLLTTGNGKDIALKKSNMIEEIAGGIIAELRLQNLTQADCGDLEKHAYSVNDSVSDNEIRYLHILAGV